MNLLTIAIVLFALAAVFGLIVLLKVLKGEATPKPAVFIHGLIAASALALVLYYVVTHAEKSPMASLVVFLIAALGGFFMFFMDMSKRPVPKGVALIHAGAAVVGLVLLIAFVAGS
jgi:hypothetical protein